VMSPAPPPVTPSRKLPPRFGVPPLVVGVVLPHAASGPASITPPANTPALISRRRRVSEVELRSPGRSAGVSAIDFLLLDGFTTSPQNDSVGDRGFFSWVVRAVPCEEPRRKTQMLGDEIWRVRVTPAQRVHQLLVVLGVGPPRIRRGGGVALPVGACGRGGGRRD